MDVWFHVWEVMFWSVARGWGVVEGGVCFGEFGGWRLEDGENLEGRACRHVHSDKLVNIMHRNVFSRSQKWVYICFPTQVHANTEMLIPNRRGILCLFDSKEGQLHIYIYIV